MSKTKKTREQLLAEIRSIKKESDKRGEQVDHWYAKYHSEAGKRELLVEEINGLKCTVRRGKLIILEVEGLKSAIDVYRDVLLTAKLIGGVCEEQRLDLESRRQNNDR